MEIYNIHLTLASTLNRSDLFHLSPVHGPHSVDIDSLTNSEILIKAEETTLQLMEQGHLHILDISDSTTVHVFTVPKAAVTGTRRHSDMTQHRIHIETVNERCLDPWYSVLYMYVQDVKKRQKGA